MEKYSIGQVSKITGVSAKTIRFYEDKKIISKAQRSENGYRYYDEAGLDEIRLIKYVKDLGLPLAEMKKLMLCCVGESCNERSDYVNKTINRYLVLLSDRIDQMKKLRSRLVNFQKSGPHCSDILQKLSITK